MSERSVPATPPAPEDAASQPPSAAPSAPPSAWGRTFAALQHPNYRLWFMGQLVSLVGTWMQTTAQGFLVFELTHSPAYLGYVGFALILAICFNWLRSRSIAKAQKAALEAVS